MNIHTFDTPQQVAKEVAQRVATLIKTKAQEGKHAVLCLPTGSTPILMYRELIRMHREENLSFKNVVTFNLDEYYPMKHSSKQSYHTFMDEHLFNHIDIDKKNVFIPSGELPAEDYEHFCEEYEAKIKSFGGLNVAIVGIGRTGHIGFNEPGSQLNDRTRIVVLNQTTRVDASSNFGGESNVPTRAVTMGIATIMDAEAVYLLATGESKSEIVYKALEDPKALKDPSNCPAVFLRGHPSFTAFLDKAAGALLKQQQAPWLLANCRDVDWNESLRKRALIHLSKTLKKGICELTHQDLNNNGLTSLLLHAQKLSTTSKRKVTLESICMETLNDLLSRIAVLPNHAMIPSDPSERVLIFSPHPDDDVISMGGIMYHMAQMRQAMLNPGDDLNIKVCYMTNGSVAVDTAVLRDHLRFARSSASLLNTSTQPWDDILAQLPGPFPTNGEHTTMDNHTMQHLKANVRRAEAQEAVQVLGLDGDRDTVFLDLPFYRTGQEKKKPLGREDINLVKNLFLEQKPKHVFVAADLTDPHGTHRVCYDAIYKALEELRTIDKVNEFQDGNVSIWLYRGAWQEFDIHESSIFVPLSKHEIEIKIQAIFKHQSQKDAPLFPGNDSREFWQRARDRNRQTAEDLGTLGLPKFYAVEAFVVCPPSQIPV
jgi:glucosamine-6-phosphate deaminase